MEDTIIDAVFLLLRAGFIYLIFKVAKRMTAATDCSKMKAYFVTIAASSLFAGVLWANHGTHTEDADPLFGGGETVVDFIPTKQERNQHGLFVLIVIGGASLAGTHSGLKARREYE